MSAETRPFVLLFTLVIITVTIIANAEPVPLPVAVITKEDAIKFLKHQIKKNIYEPAKKQVMPIVKAMTTTFAEGVKNATSVAIMKGRDTYVQMKQANDKNKEEKNKEKKERGEKDNIRLYDDFE